MFFVNLIKCKFKNKDTFPNIYVPLDCFKAEDGGKIILSYCLLALEAIQP